MVYLLPQVRSTLNVESTLRARVASAGMGRAVVEGAPGEVRTDGSMLLLVVEEAISNALKYSMEGSPISVVARFSERAGALKVSIDSLNSAAVRELSPKECEHVFSPGAKGPGATWDSTGVGLNTTRRAAVACGGAVTLRMVRVPRGVLTTLELTLPAEPATTTAPAPAKKTPLEGDGPPPLHGLVCVGIDDCAFLRLHLKNTFELGGADGARSRVLGATADEQVARPLPSQRHITQGRHQERQRRRPRAPRPPRG